MIYAVVRLPATLPQSNLILMLAGWLTERSLKQ